MQEVSWSNEAFPLRLFAQPVFQCSMPACEAPRSVLCSSVKDGIGISVLFKRIGKCPIRARVELSNRFQICFSRKIAAAKES
jgi:hypothetical protein